MHSSAVLTPLNIHTMTVRNRFVLPAMVTDMGGTGGYVTEQLLRYYEERARGGVGLVIVEATSVAPSGRSFVHGLDISDDRFIPGLRRLTDCVHRHGARIAIQLQHGGRAANPALSGMPRRIVSLIPGVTDPNNSLVLEVDELQELANGWVSASLRAREAGFDSVEIHGASGYLLHQFVSPFTNQRTDSYGGDEVRRSRFPLEVVAAVRKAMGPDYPILYRHASLEDVPGGNGITLAATLNLCKSLVEVGVNGLNITAGMQECRELLGPPMCMPQAWNAATSAAVKKVVGDTARVLLTGRVISPDVAERVISQGEADFVITGRALIADPHMPRKLAENRREDIIPCISCNEGCVGNAMKAQPITCALNPLSGREAYGRDEPRAATPRNVLVIGGGPAGMQTALTASRRGHRVTLLERAPRLGGLLQVAALPPHKGELLGVVSYYENALRKQGVQVECGQDVTVDTVVARKPDIVVVATGSCPVLPRFCAQAPNLCTASEVLCGEKAVGERVLVLGGGLVGCETAEFLLERGKQVTVVEMRGELAPDMEARARKLLLRHLQEGGVSFLVNTEILTVECDGSVEVRVDGKEQRLQAFDALVIAVGYAPENSLVQALEEAGLACCMAGDCVTPGKIMNAVHQGFTVAMNLN